MQLVVDASTLVAEALRKRGHRLLSHAGVDLIAPVDVWQETAHELRKRAVHIAERHYLDSAAATRLLDGVLALVTASVTIVPQAVYQDRLGEAAGRIPRDHRDTPVVALALTLHCGIWTGDYDFFGCGLPVWATEVLINHLDHST